MKYRVWLGLTSLITFICVEALLAFGYGCITEQNFLLVMQDKKFLLVALLLLLILLVWTIYIFLGSIRTIRRRKNRKWRYMRLNKIMTIVAVVSVAITVICKIQYDRYLDYPGANSYKKAILKSYQTNLENGLDVLNRHGLWDGNIIVAHALGGLDGQTYVLSAEALNLNYSNGFRVFEIDLVETLDGDLAIQHYWSKKKNGEYNTPTTEAYVAGKINGKYTPLLFTDIVQFMQDHKDAWFIPDFKVDVSGSSFQRLVEEAEMMNASDVLDRIIPQIFDIDMFNTIQAIYPFPSYVYGSYMYWDGNVDTFEAICKACVENQIDSVSMWNYYCTEEIVAVAHHYNLDVYVHSENNFSEAVRFLEMGVTGIYTDFIEPSKLEDYK